MEQLLTTGEVTKILQISLSKLEKMVRRREIPHVRLGRQLRFKPSELAHYIAQHEIPCCEDGKNPGKRRVQRKQPLRKSS